MGRGGYILSMMSTPCIIVTLTLLASWLAPARCRGEGFPAPFNSEKDAAAMPLPAAEAAAAMDVPTGFRVSVFAAEPDVQNPIAMAWDARGRLWIAENHTYAERPLRMEARLRDRVIVFADRDRDGRADERKVFLDDLQQITSVEVGLGGVWLLCPPSRSRPLWSMGRRPGKFSAMSPCRCWPRPFWWRWCCAASTPLRHLILSIP